jgi:hypothetical protein
MRDKSPNVSEEDILNDQKVKAYAEAVSKLNDETENRENLENYKQSVLQLMF